MNNYKCMKIDKRKFVICLLLSLIYSFFNVLGYLVYNKLDVLQIMLLFFSNCILFFIICFFLMSKLFIPKNKNGKLYKIKYFKTTVIIILFLLSLPAFIASFPGVFSYDAPYQVTQFLTGKLSNYQPFLVSVFLYSIISIGKIVFSSYEIGLALFIVIQMFICFYVVASLLEYLKSKNVSSIILVLIILFFGLFPINNMFIVNSGKDTLFSYFFLLFSIYNVKMVDNPKLFFSKNSNLIKYILLCLVVLFYRNNMIYVWFITILVYIFIFKDYQKQFRVILIFTILPYFIVCYPLYTFLNVTNDNTREMMSIPAQSITRIYLKHKDEFNSKDMNMMKYYFGDENIRLLKRRYRPYNSDNTKFSIGHNRLASNSFGFVRLFVNLSVRYPKEFFETCIYNTIGYWYPGLKYNKKYFEPQKYIEYNNTDTDSSFKIKRYKFIPFLSDYYLKLGESNDNVNYLGVFKFLGNLGFILWCYLFLIFYAIYKRRYKVFLMLLPLILVFFTNLLGPVALFRYVYYLLIGMPLFIVLIIDGKKVNL